MAKLPDFLDGYLEFTKGHEGTPRCHLWSAISVVAGALERKVWLHRGFYTLFPNLYVFIIGRSGIIKKSTTTGIAVDLLREVNGVKMMSERLTAAALINQLATSQRSFESKGYRIRQSAVYAYASELSIFLEEVNGSILDLLTTFFDCVPNDSSKPWVYATKHKGTTQIFGPCLNILGASTKAWLRKSLPRREMEGGFTSRVLFVVENSAPENLVAWPEATEHTALRRHLVSDLQRIFGMTGPVTVSPAAREMFTAWYHHHMKEVVPMQSDPAFSGYLGRKGDMMLKLAIIKMACQGGSMVIEESHLRWAGEELEKIEPDMKTAFFDYVAPVSTEVMFDMLSFIKAKNFTTRSELKQVFGNRTPLPLIDRAINELVTLKEVEFVERGDDKGGGRKIYIQPTSF